MRRVIVAASIVLAISLLSMQPGHTEYEPPLQCAPEPTNMLIHYGDVIICAMDPVGDGERFRFAGNDGEVIVIKVTRTSGFPEPCIELFAPGGASLAEACALSNSNRIDIQPPGLTESGRYTILVHAQGNDAVLSQILRRRS